MGQRELQTAIVRQADRIAMQQGMKMSGGGRFTRLQRRSLCSPFTCACTVLALAVNTCQCAQHMREA